MDWEEFFRKYGLHTLCTLQSQDIDQQLRVEDLYFAFKARFIAEVLSKGFVPMGPA